MAALERMVEVLQVFGETARVRLAALLEGRELSVAELTAITEMAQSRVSAHLARLKDAGVVCDRRQGTATFYRMNDGSMPAEARDLWTVVAKRTDGEVLRADRDRCERILAARRGSSWSEMVAGEMERHYSPGRTWESLTKGLLGLLELGRVLDVGSGDGTVAELIAPRARRMTCVDRSEKVIEAARRRLARHDNVEVQVADAHELPFDDGCFDQVLLFHVLDQVKQRSRVLAECARVLAPGGSLVVLALDQHRHGDAVAAYGHVHRGLAPAALARLLARAGLRVDSCAATTRERRPPHFQVVSALATKPRTP